MAVTTSAFTFFPACFAEVLLKRWKIESEVMMARDPSYARDKCLKCVGWENQCILDSPATHAFLV